MTGIICPYTNENGYCDSTACHNMNVVGNIIPEEQPENINIGNSSRWVKPHGNWHKGTPTENGYYLVHMTIYDEEYDLCLDFKDGTWDDRKWGFGYNYKILAYQKIEPYKED